MNDERQLKEFGLILLDIGSLLMSSGASASRIRMTVNRISEGLGFYTDIFITNRALTLTVRYESNSDIFSSTKRTSPHGVNFRVVSGLSRMSWRIVEEKWSLQQIRDEVERLVSLPHYPRYIVLLVIGLAGASFCRLFGGKAVDMLTCFVATLVGLFVRQEAIKLRFNPYLSVYFAATVASLIAGAAIKFNIGISPEQAFTASVLFLIPGVPLINMFSDLIDGNILNGLIRGVNGLIIAFAIALGLLTSMIIYSF
jgi:uncharacterized membrane protein YjjP (DUF1212 family)